MFMLVASIGRLKPRGRLPAVTAVTDLRFCLAARGADFSIVWPKIFSMAVIGAVYFAFAHRRFRRVIFDG
jgi:hypothetical protein